MDGSGALPRPEDMFEVDVVFPANDDELIFAAKRAPTEKWCTDTILAECLAQLHDAGSMI